MTLRLWQWWNQTPVRRFARRHVYLIRLPTQRRWIQRAKRDQPDFKWRYGFCLRLPRHYFLLVTR